MGAGAAEVAGDEDEAGGGCCCTTASSFGGVLGAVAGVVAAGGLTAEELGPAAGGPAGLEDEPPEQRPLVSGLGKTLPCAGVLAQVLPSQRAPLLTGRLVGGERMMV